jgi:hypothetical protein
MTDAAAEALTDLVAKWQRRVAEARRAGDCSALLSTAEAAATEIEGRVGEGRSAAEREALIAVRRFGFNAAADCWPGWNVPETPPDARILLRALQLAKRSAALVTELSLGGVQEGTGTWLLGAFELALGRHEEAYARFASRASTTSPPGRLV